MDVEKSAFELIALTYDAALAPEKWQQVMTGFIQNIGTNSALLREADYTTGNVGLYKTVGFDPTFTKAYREHFVHLDFFAPALLREPVGAVTRGDHVLPWDQQRKTEFCNDYLLAQNNRYCLGITLAREKNRHLLFALQRSKQQGDFTKQDLKFIHLVAPHMTRAINIHRQMLAVTAQNNWALSALNQLKIGIILLNDHGQPVFINTKADTLMSEGCGLSISREQLALHNNFDSARLQRFITDAILTASGFISRAGGSLRTFNYLGAPLSIHVIPLPRDKSEQPWGVSLSNGCAAVFLSIPGRTQLNPETLSKLYSFTPAEAKLAALLADGLSLETAASTLTISIQTARSQLKAVFAKAQVSRQAELVAHLLSDTLSHQLTN